MQIIDIRDVEKTLLKLIEGVKQGQEFILVDDGAPVARLTSALPAGIVRKPGSMRGKIRIAEDFDASLEDDVIATFEGRSKN